MAFVAAVALAAAALEVWRSRESQGTVAYRFASVALLVIFGFFLQTRFTSSPTATLVALALGIPAAAYFPRAARSSQLSRAGRRGRPVLGGDRARARNALTPSPTRRVAKVGLGP